MRAHTVVQNFLVGIDEKKEEISCKVDSLFIAIAKILLTIHNFFKYLIFCISKLECLVVSVEVILSLYSDVDGYFLSLIENQIYVTRYLFFFKQTFIVPNIPYNKTTQWHPRGV